MSQEYLNKRLAEIAAAQRPTPEPTFRKLSRDAGPLTRSEKFQMRLCREAGMTVAQVARYYGVSMATAFRALAELRAIMGPEKLKNRHLARAHLHQRPAMSQDLTSNSG